MVCLSSLGVSPGIDLADRDLEPGSDVLCCLSAL